MEGKFLVLIFCLVCVLTITPAYALIGAEGTNFSSNGYETVISIEFDEAARTLYIVEGGGGGSGSPMYSLLTIKVYDNTTDFPYVEVWDDEYQVMNFTMYEKEVAKIWIENNGTNETVIIITDMIGDKSAWINLVDKRCTGYEDIRQFWVYKEGAGFPDAVIRTWLNDCEQFIVPLYIDKFVI